MLIREAIAAATPTNGRVIYAQGCGRWVRQAALSASDTEMRPGDCYVLALDRGASTEELIASIAPVVEGANAVILINSGVGELAVGRFIDAILGADLQALAALAVEEEQVEAVLVLTRSASLAPIWPYLSPETPLPLDARVIRRLVTEYVVDGAARRSRELAEQREVASLHTQLSNAKAETESMRLRAKGAEAEVIRLTESIEALRASRSYEVGQALADVRRSPVSGIIALPGKVRRAGDGESGQ